MTTKTAPPLAAAQSRNGSAFDVDKIREDFPLLRDLVHGKKLVYLDNAATSQKPQAVIDALTNYYRHQNANIHRGVYRLSEIATAAYENTRRIVKNFLNASSEKEIIFVNGATAGINLVAQSYGRKFLRAGDEIIVSTMEHHSNLVPWQMLCEMTGARLRVVPLNENGELVEEEYERLLNDKTKLVAVVHVSNSLGTINPIKRMIARAHGRNVPVLIDGAQAAPHLRVDVQELDCDFYVFSAHKIFGPTGVGVLFGKESRLEKMPPYQGGGDMIKSVTLEKTIYHDPPHRFEAGTPNISGVIGMGKALEYVQNLGYDNIGAYEDTLLHYASAVLSGIKPLRIIGTAREKAPVISFVLEGIHPHDVGTILDRQGVAIRTGHHCTQPVMKHFDVPATSRASFAFYNTKAEIDALAAGLHGVIKLMA